jgi:hypothetical protein
MLPGDASGTLSQSQSDAMRKKTGQCSERGLAASVGKAVFFFRLKVILPEGEGLSGRSELWQRTFSGGPSRQS